MRTKATVALSSTLQRCQEALKARISRRAAAPALLTRFGLSPRTAGATRKRADDISHSLGERRCSEDRGRTAERLGQSFTDPHKARQRSDLDDDRHVQLLHVHGAARRVQKRSADQSGTQAGHPQVDAGVSRPKRFSRSASIAGSIRECDASRSAFGQRYLGGLEPEALVPGLEMVRARRNSMDGKTSIPPGHREVAVVGNQNICGHPRVYVALQLDHSRAVWKS